ncbi:MAG: hypothetical protein HKL80_03765 [Acidimicrobiales bacterium]|nr:hypothetical protein [Acidimicrobiales bacterium]
MKTDGTLEKTVVTIGCVKVKQKLLLNLRVGFAISAELMSVFVELLRRRNSEIAQAYASRFTDEPNLPPRKTSVFCDPSNVLQLLSHPNTTDKCSIFGAQPTDIFRDIFALYLPFCNNDCWSLLVIFTEQRKIYYVNPMVPNFSPFSADELSYFENAVNSFFFSQNILLPNDSRFTCEEYPYQYYETASEKVDTGVYLFLIMYFICETCPISFQQQEISGFRTAITHWIISARLPI